MVYKNEPLGVNTLFEVNGDVFGNADRDLAHLRSLEISNLGHFTRTRKAITASSLTPA